MDKKRILKAKEIVEYALKNDVSVKKACTEYGFGNTYVKNIKAKLIKEYDNGLISKADYDLFFNTYNNYLKKNNAIKDNDQFKNIINNKLTKKETNNNIDIDYTSNSSYPKGHIKTLDQLLEKCEVDKKIWKVKDYIINKWDVTSWKKQKPETIENFQVKARLEKNVYEVSKREIIEYFKDSISKYKPPIFNDIPREHIVENNLIEICLFDTHFNKLVWAEETDDEYDVEIAEKRYIGSILNFLERVKNFGYNRILYPIGNDFFNSDTNTNNTTAGTPQDNQLLWHNAFKRGTKLIKDSIYLLKKQGVPIDVLIIPGNHDYVNSFYLGEYLSAWFKDDPLVNIDNSSNPRKYYSYGNLLLGFTHGSEEKRDSLPMLMANKKDLWAKSVYREWHLGHFHRKKNYKYTILDKGMELDEEEGVFIRYLSSLAGSDSWHNKKGFVNNIKAGDGFVWSHDKGLIAHININI